MTHRGKPSASTRRLALIGAVGACLAILPVAASAGALRVDTAPERLWRALTARLESDAVPYARMDRERFTVDIAPAAGAARISVDWDERSGGAKVGWNSPDAPADAATRRWLEEVARDAAALAQENLYCRRGDASAVAEGFLDIAPDETPDCGVGKFSAALFELEKCGDHESALKILAACVRERNSLGMLRLAQHFENGYAVPKSPERMTEYLRRAAEAGTPGYGIQAWLQYATALYFGIGTAPDRPAALQIFERLAGAGNVDALHFLRHGYHFAWRRQDGTVYRDPSFGAAGATR